MFAKLLTTSAFLLALTLQVSAHAAVSPALGVSGTPVRGDVKRPNGANACGAGVNIAGAIDSSTAVNANAAGTFSATAINFNGGGDGSRQFTAKVDASGTGKSFVAMTVTTNGDPKPANVGTQPIVANLPAGTKCTGGASKNKCLVQFVSSAGFGNCVAVTQGGAAAAAGGAQGGAKKGGAKKQKQNRKRSGTTAARALLADIEERGEEAYEVVKREIASWLWA